MVISIDGYKYSDKIQHAFMIRYPGKLRIEGNFLNVIKTINQEPIANIIGNGENL